MTATWPQPLLQNSIGSYKKPKWIFKILFEKQGDRERDLNVLVHTKKCCNS